jgi:hypothetical protein
MKTEYSDTDIERAREWYAEHKAHVDRLMEDCNQAWPMSGSDIARPELWKPAAWNWFFGRLGSAQRP